MRPVVTKLVERAQAAGALRADFRPTDVADDRLPARVGRRVRRPAQPEVWRRYLALIIDGMRAARGVSELPVPALTPDEIEQCMRASAQRLPSRR